MSSPAKTAKRRGKQATKQTKSAKQITKKEVKQLSNAVVQKIERMEIRGTGRGEVDQATLVLATAAKLRKKFSPQIWKYAMMLHDPEVVTTRYPDRYGKKTALYRSIQEFFVPINTDGRFAVLAMPKLGSLDDVRHYKAYVPAANAPGWTTGDWTDPVNYLPDFSRSSDPRVDPEVETFRGTGGSKCLEVVGGQTTAIASSDDPLLFGNASSNVLFNDTGVTMTTDLTSSVLTFPSLQFRTTYRLHFAVWIRTGAAASIWFAAVPASVIDATLTASAGIVVSGSNTGAGATVGPGILQVDNTGNLIAHSRAYSFDVPPGGGNVRFDATGGLPWYASPTFAAGPWTWRTTLTRIPYGDRAPPGLMTAGRVIAQSVLLKWVGPTLFNGGVAACALAPRGVLRNNLFQTQPAGGFHPFQWETYQRLKGETDTMHTNRLDKGAYVSYEFTDIADEKFLELDDMNALEEPAPLCIAGQYAPGGPISQGVFRVRFTQIMEYTTTSDIPELGTTDYPTSTAMSDAAYIHKALGIQSASENDFHSVVTNVLGEAEHTGNRLGRVVGATAGGIIGGFKDASGTLPAAEFNLSKGTIGVGFKELERTAT